MPNDKLFKDTWGGQLGMSAAGNVANGLIGGIMGQIFAKKDDKRQISQAQKLQAMQMAGNKEMIDYQKGADLEMWKATSYPGQIEMMKQAGVNPALLYGGGGGGGSTTGGTASVGGQSAGTRSDAIQGMGMMMQNQLIAAQTENIKAQTEKTKADTELTKGPTTDKLVQETDNLKTQQALTQIQADIQGFEREIKGETTKAAIWKFKYETDQALQTLNMLKNNAVISENTWSKKIELVEQEYIGAILRNELTQAQTTQTGAQTAKTEAEIQNMAKQIQLAYAQLKNEQDKTKVQQKLQEFQTSFGGQASQILGQLLQFIPGKSKAN